MWLYHLAPVESTKEYTYYVSWSVQNSSPTFKIRSWWFIGGAAAPITLQNCCSLWPLNSPNLFAFKRHLGGLRAKSRMTYCKQKSLRWWILNLFRSHPIHHIFGLFFELFELVQFPSRSRSSLPKLMAASGKSLRPDLAVWPFIRLLGAVLQLNDFGPQKTLPNTTSNWKAWCYIISQHGKNTSSRTNPGSIALYWEKQRLLQHDQHDRFEAV